MKKTILTLCIMLIGFMAFGQNNPNAKRKYWVYDYEDNRTILTDNVTVEYIDGNEVYSYGLENAIIRTGLVLPAVFTNNTNERLKIIGGPGELQE